MVQYMSGMREDLGSDLGSMIAMTSTTTKSIQMVNEKDLEQFKGLA